MRLSRRLVRGCGVAAGAWVLAGCAGRLQEAAPRRSCAATERPYEVTLARPGPQVTLGERTFNYAWRRTRDVVEVVIVALDERGALVTTPVPVGYADAVAIAGDAGGLWIVALPFQGRGSLLRVTLAEDGSLRAEPPTPLPEVVWGWPAELTSDGARARLVHRVATAEQTRGAPVAYTIDLATRRVVATEPAADDETRVCDAGGCTTIALRWRGDAGTLRVAGPGGSAEVAAACGQYFVFEGPGERVVAAPGQPWRRIVAGPTRVSAEGLARGPGGDDCGSGLFAWPSRGWPGVLEVDDAGRSLVRWDPRRRAFGRREALPATTHARTLRAEHPDGVIEVEWTASEGLAHDPAHDPPGMREYFMHWQFDGGAARLLRRAADGWAAVDAVTLPLAGAHGTFHDGYAPAVLRSGAHAAVLLAPTGGSEPAWVVPFLRGCAGGRAEAIGAGAI